MSSATNVRLNEIKSNSKIITQKFEPTTEGLLRYATAPNWLKYAATLPTPPKLFGSLVRQGEFSLLFADMGSGKTIAGYQIAQTIANGKTEEKYVENEADPQLVFYGDFELDVKQWENRFKDETTGETFPLSENIIRTELDLSEFDFSNDNLQDKILADILRLSLEKNIKVWIIDNITYISDTGDYRGALKFMQKLNTLKKQYKLTILLMGHTPKRDLREPITENSLSGSKKMIDLADSSFAIGKSAKDPNFRYIKQIKVRWTKFEYGADNVLSCEIVKKNNFVQLKVSGTDSENSHLKKVGINDKRDEEIIEMRKKGITQAAIGEEFGISDRQVRNIIYKSNDSLGDGYQY
jgi:KaiC/GvpD/RAD55 family RecA-like ATPase